MEPDEFETWFEQEKEKLAEEYSKKINKTKDYAKLKQEFSRKFRALLEKYNTFYDKSEKREKMKKRVVEPLNRLSEEIDKLVENFKEET